MNAKAAKQKHNRIFIKNDKLTDEALSAWEVLHIDPNLLASKTKDSFKGPGVNDAIAEVRYYHYEEKRKALIHEIEEYLKGLSMRNTNNSFMRR